MHAADPGIGPPGSHIEQFTGYPPIRSSTTCTHHGIAARSPSAFSPRYQRTYPPQSP